jgi:hypothetical protein
MTSSGGNLGITPRWRSALARTKRECPRNGHKLDSCPSHTETVQWLSSRLRPVSEHRNLHSRPTRLGQQQAPTVHPKEYGWAAPPTTSAFPTDLHYEAKAWEVCQAEFTEAGALCQGCNRSACIRVKKLRIFTSEWS